MPGRCQRQRDLATGPAHRAVLPERAHVRTPPVWRHSAEPARGTAVASQGYVSPSAKGRELLVAEIAAVRTEQEGCFAEVQLFELVELPAVARHAPQQFPSHTQVVDAPEVSGSLIQ